MWLGLRVTARNIACYYSRHCVGHRQSGWREIKLDPVTNNSLLTCTRCACHGRVQRRRGWPCETLMLTRYVLLHRCVTSLSIIAGLWMRNVSRIICKSKIPLRYLVRSWFEAGRRQVQSWSPELGFKKPRAGAAVFAVTRLMSESIDYNNNC